MAPALSAPFAVCAIVLIVAGVAKLRAPREAALALGTLGWPASRALVRVLALGEVVLGTVSLFSPGRALAALVALAYAVFAVLSLMLAARRACRADASASVKRPPRACRRRSAARSPCWPRRARSRLPTAWVGSWLVR